MMEILDLRIFVANFLSTSVCLVPYPVSAVTLYPLIELVSEGDLGGSAPFKKELGRGGVGGEREREREKERERQREREKER